MKILLVSATQFELEVNNTNLEGIPHHGHIHRLIGGVGIAPTTFWLTKTLLQSKYDLVIQAGIGGTFTDEVLLGEVVLIGADTFADAGIEAMGSFTNLFASGLAEQSAFPFTNGWLVNEHELLNNLGLKAVKAITVNKITDDKRDIAQQEVMYGAQVESMEGAALHYVYLQLNVPFLQMRSVSNSVGERDKTKWKLKEAIDNLNSALRKTLSTLLNVN